MSEQRQLCALDADCYHSFKAYLNVFNGDFQAFGSAKKKPEKRHVDRKVLGPCLLGPKG